MKNDIHFWVATLVRGVMALLVGSAVLVIPDMATTLLLLPFAVAVSILCLAAYGILDSATIFTTSFMAASARARIALCLQGIMGSIVGLLLFFVVFDKVRLHWFLYLIGLQALCTGAAEWVVAKHASTQETSIWNYAASAIAFLCGGAYIAEAAAFGEDLMPRTVAFLIFGYLVAFGMAECITAARMLYADREADIVAAVCEA